MSGRRVCEPGAKIRLCELIAIPVRFLACEATLEAMPAGRPELRFLSFWFSSSLLAWKIRNMKILITAPYFVVNYIVCLISFFHNVRFVAEHFTASGS